MRYDHREEVTRRLSQCVVLHRGLPVYVLEAAATRIGDYTIYVANLPSQTTKYNISLSDPELNYSKFNLGYVNLEDCVLYLRRIPARGTHQGLINNNVELQAYPAQHQLDTYSLTSLVTMPGFVDMFQRHYPSLEEAYEEVISEATQARAFSWDWALSLHLDMPTLIYKGRAVCLCSSPKTILKLPQKYTYLKERLAEIGATV